MDLKAQILREHSKRQTVKITEWIGSDPERFRRLVDLFLHGDHLITQRTAWVIGHCGERHPALLSPWLPAMLEKIQEPGIHAAAVRNVIRILQNIEIPRKILGTVVTLCFNYLSSPGCPIAIRVYSMTILEEAVRREPGLRNELEAVIEQMLPHSGAGLRARSRQVLKNLRALDRVSSLPRGISKDQAIRKTPP